MLRKISRLFRGPAPPVTPPADPRVERAAQWLQAGRLDQAEQACRAILAADPENAGAHNILGGIATRLDRHDLAVGHFANAVRFDGDRAAYHQGLGFAYFNTQDFNRAIASFKKAVALAPHDPAIRNNLGNIYKERGNLAEAMRCYSKAIALNPDHVTAHLNLADTLNRQQQYPAAIDAFRETLRVADDRPEHAAQRAMAHHRMGLALRKLGRTDEAIASYRQAIEIDPNFALAHNSLGGALMRQNDLEPALACFRRALQIEPSDYHLHSNLLLTMNYLAGMAQQDIHRESLKFDARYARAFTKSSHHFTNARTANKVLKVGYVSPDFRDHSVAHFIRDLLGSHDRRHFEVYCYANVEAPDDLTRHFQSQADHWRSILETGDAAVAESVRADGIDILVDLSGHTAMNRLLVFARKPAPVQVTWLGYPNTTGLRAMDYRLTDAVADPPGDADRLHREKLVRLPGGFLCYQPEAGVPAVSPPPSSRRGHVAFGSFNAIMKTTPEVVAAWSRILHEVAGSRLVLKAEALNDGTMKQKLLQAFAGHGVAAERLELIDWIKDRKTHLELYAGIDIALDPFPYNGTTTTCEALWMGVPVICLQGDRHAGRVGTSIMQHAGFPDFVTASEDDYVAAASALAADQGRMAALRASQREQMRDSALMDLAGFTAALEAAYRDMWRNWCGGTGLR